jgi:hypothetical protein
LGDLCAGESPAQKGTRKREHSAKIRLACQANTTVNAFGPAGRSNRFEEFCYFGWSDLIVFPRIPSVAETLFIEVSPGMAVAMSPAVLLSSPTAGVTTK